MSAKAVFLSYASQDAEAARRICTALQAAGLDVWFDQSELRGGDAWDASIRRQIRECALFVPVISANTQAREEGYFRREWNLAVNRTQDMAQGKAFLIPVVIDATLDARALVPEKFLEVQWSHLPGGETPPAFVERVKRLLTDSPAARAAAAVPPVAAPPAPTVLPHPPAPQPVPHGIPGPLAAASFAPGSAPPLAGASGLKTRRGTLIALGALAVVVLVASVAFFTGRLGAAPADAGPSAATASSVAGAFAPPPHSLAVLPFVNMSGDPRQDYFSDGLSEELLNSLVTIRDLQVAARTSSFYFKGKDVDLTEVARKLNVGAILEGSVRKDGNQVRITAQLINAVTGYHLWSQTYDRDLKNVLSLQSEIAASVTSALQATLLAGASTSIELGGTRNPQAFDAYLRGERLQGRIEKDSIEARVAAFDDALKLDPEFVKAMIGKARALSDYSGYIAVPADYARYNAQALALARKAVALAPDLGDAHNAMSRMLLNSFDFAQAVQEMERSLVLAGGDVAALRAAASTLILVGQSERALGYAQRAAVLDPLNGRSYAALGYALMHNGQYRQAIDALDRARVMEPSLSLTNVYLGQVYFKLGEFDNAVQACSRPPENMFGHVCLAVLEHHRGHQDQAQAQLEIVRRTNGDSAAFQYGEIYAAWGDTPKALDWLETAYELRDTGLTTLASSLFLDPVRKEQRYRQLARKLNIPG